MRVRVFGINGTNPRTLEGHTRSVEAAVPLAPRGKLVITASKDSTARLWRVADAKCLHTFRLAAPANAITLGSRPPGYEGGLRPPDGDDAVVGSATPAVHPEDLQEDLLALVALHNGTVAVLDLHAQTVVTTFTTGTTSPALAIAYDVSSGLVVTGHLDGRIVLQRLGAAAGDSPPLAVFRRGTRAAIHAVVFSADAGSSLSLPTLLVAGEDGLPYRAAFSETGGDVGVAVHVAEEYMGLDTDSVSVLREAHGSVFAASKDGCVRRW